MNGIIAIQSLCFMKCVEFDLKSIRFRDLDKMIDYRLGEGIRVHTL